MYNISGYTDDLCDFSYSISGYVEAVKHARELERQLCVVFLSREGKPVKY